MSASPRQPPMPEHSSDPRGFHATLPDSASLPVSVRVANEHLTIDGASGPVAGFHLADVREVERRGDRIEISLLRRTPVVLESDAAESLDAALVAACCTVPELARALRSLGSARTGSGRDGGGSAQREFFAPLLEARRRAEDSVGRAGIVRAFDPDRLNRALDAYLTQLASRHTDARPAARRAFAAQVEEAVAPLRTAIEEVRRTGPAAATPPAEARVGSWRRWSQALHALFTIADQCWDRLQPAAGGKSLDP